MSKVTVLEVLYKYIICNGKFENG